MEVGGGRGVETRELHRVGAGESSTSTTADTNTSFSTPSATKEKMQKYVAQKLAKPPSKFE